MSVLYTIGDSITWGSELNNREHRYSTLLSKEFNLLDFNCASSGISNDRIYRNTIRDVCKFLNGNEISNHDYGTIKTDKIFVMVQFTSPTRMDYFNGDLFENYRIWPDYDKWGDIDNNKKTENEFIIKQNSMIPSLIRLFHQTITLEAFLTINKIPHLIYNGFFNFTYDELEKYDSVNLNNHAKDIYDTNDNYFGLTELYRNLPSSYNEINLFSYLNSLNIKNLFAERGHPNEKGHKLIKEYLKSKLHNIIQDTQQ